MQARLGEARQAIGCYWRALALVRALKTPEARAMQASMLAGSGDACQAAGDLPATVEAWQQASQVLRDLGWPDLLGVGARLEQAGHPQPGRLTIRLPPRRFRSESGYLQVPRSPYRLALATASS